MEKPGHRTKELGRWKREPVEINPALLRVEVSETMNDPIEAIVATALERAGLHFVTDEGGGNPAGLDFYLPDYDLHIEVKQFHSQRIAEQMARAENVIVIQGRKAAEWFSARLR